MIALGSLAARPHGRTARQTSRTRSALVLCYHSLVDLSDDPVLADYGLAPQAFAAQLDKLIARGFNFISPDQFAAFLQDGACLPRKAVLLTFDDCYAELLPVARSILLPRAIPALAFAVTGTRAGTNQWDHAAGARTLRLLDETGLRELSRVGVEVGSHSRTHRPLTVIPAQELRQETAGTAADFARMALPAPRFFAYPHGQRDGPSMVAVREAGFVGAFGMRCRLLRRSDNPHDLPRVVILHRDGSFRFWLKTSWPLASVLLEARRILRRAWRSRP